MTLAKVISTNIISQSKVDRKAKKRVGDWEKIEKAVSVPEWDLVQDGVVEVSENYDKEEKEKEEEEKKEKKQ